MRATDPIFRQRVEDVLRVRLDGAEGWDVRRYVAEMEAKGEPPWKIEEDGKTLSERQIRNYVAAADKLIAESCRQSRNKLLRQHQAQRRNLYARCVNKGDERTALAVLRDLAELQGLYGDEVTRQLEELRQCVEALTRGDDGSGSGNPGGTPGPVPDDSPSGGGAAGYAALDPAAPGPGGDLPGGADDAGPLADETPALPLFPPANAV